MGKKEKLLQRLLSMPKDFTFEEMQSLLEALGYQRNNKGKTSVSRVMFIKDGSIIMLHKPHPRKELLEYQLKQIIDKLKEDELI